MKTASNYAPLRDVTLWDSEGNSCRTTAYPLGDGTFELFLIDFNSSVPRRYVGGIGIINNVADHFIRTKLAAGFVEQLPSYNSEAWRA